MNDHTISLVRESFDLVTPIAPQAAALKTLRQGLGAAWVPEVEEAWTEVYGVLAGTMKEAAAVPA